MKKLLLSSLFTIYYSLFICSAQNDGDFLFNSSQIHTIKFYFSQAKWYDSLITYKPLDKK